MYGCALAPLSLWNGLSLKLACGMVSWFDAGLLPIVVCVCSSPLPSCGSAGVCELRSFVPLDLTPLSVEWGPRQPSKAPNPRIWGAYLWRGGGGGGGAPPPHGMRRHAGGTGGRRVRRRRMGYGAAGRWGGASELGTDLQPQT